MLHLDRIKKLAQLLEKQGLDVIYMGPSTDIEYLAELRLFDDERVKGLAVARTGKCFAMTPLIYEEEMREVLGQTMDYRVWADHEGFHSGYAQGISSLGLPAAGQLKIAINDGVRAVDLLEMMKTVAADYRNGMDTLSPLRSRKDEEELDCMRRASRLTDDAMKALSQVIRRGMTEREIREKLLAIYADLGAAELSFSPIIASGPGASIPHYTGDSRAVQDGDFIVVDTGCRYKGYCSDSSRTFAVGEATPEMKKIYATVLEAQNAGEAAVKRGASGQDVDRAARAVIKAAGYGEYFLNRTGHGVGIAIHEDPYIIEGNDRPLEPGNVFSIEPGIYIAGKLGVRIENLVAVREDGSGEPLNTYVKELVTVG